MEVVINRLSGHKSIRAADNVHMFKRLLKTHFLKLLNRCYLLVTLLLKYFFNCF